MTPYYADDLVTIYHGDCREWMPEADVIVTDPPYGVEFVGKWSKTGRRGDGYSIGHDDAGIGPEVVRRALEFVKRGGVFTSTVNLFAYPKPYDIGCVFMPSGSGMGKWGWQMFQPVAFYGPRPTNEAYPSSFLASKVPVRDAYEAGHPCPKPMTWMRWLVGLTSCEGETVIDPFMGSGTTLRAAKDLNRRAIGIEIEERYCEIAATRCSQEVLGLVV